MGGLLSVIPACILFIWIFSFQLLIPILSHWGQEACLSFGIPTCICFVWIFSFSTFYSNFLTATTGGGVSPLLFPLASLIVAASLNAPPSFHRAARGSFRRRRSPERRAVGIPPLPIIIQCSPLFLCLSHVVDTLANIQTRKTWFTETPRKIVIYL